MYTTPDRRIKPRIVCDYPAVVVGVNDRGEKYKDDATLANLSGSGLFMWASHCIENGAQLSVTISLTTSQLQAEEIPKLATRGVVVRTEPQPNGTCGVAIKFNHYRFL